MIDVLCIGQYNKEGRFTAKQWQCFLEWCEAMCDEVVVFTPMTCGAIHERFPQHCKISIQKKPDALLDVQSYRIKIEAAGFWRYMDQLNFDIDMADGISHLFFFEDKKCIASLEIVDYQNYVFFEDAIPVDRRLTLPHPVGPGKRTALQQWTMRYR